MISDFGNLTSLQDIRLSYQRFGIADYVVFTLMLVGCSGVGLFYALRGKSKSNSDEATEYLMGGRNMSVFPISMSLVASFISGITLLGLPTEIYLFGSDYMYICFGYMITGTLAGIIYLPVFHNLRLSSTYEYLSMRFDNKVRMLSSVFFAFGLTCWLPIVIYVPALAFNQVTGANVHVITPLVCLVCIFYTSIGGLKAVVWTDVIQIFLMVGSIIVLMIKGTLDVGGFQTLWDRAYDSGRLSVPSTNLDFMEQYTVWSIVVGGAIHCIPASVLNQNYIQRFLTLPTLSLTIRALVIYILGIIFFTLVTGYCGLLAFAHYFDCDPLTTGLAKAKDQVIPLLVMQVMGEYPGMPGLFVAGVFSAALSSLSTGLNSMSAVVLEDFIKANRKEPLSERATGYILKSVVVIFGIICVGLVFLVEKLGSVLQLSIGLSAITSGSALGLFTSGVLLPFVNAKGALYGGVSGMICMTILVFGNQRAQATGALNIPRKFTTIEGCNYQFPMPPTINSTLSVDGSAIFPLYRLSYLWYTTLGGVITITFATIISLATRKENDVPTNPDLFSPVIRRWLPENISSLTTPEERELLEILKKKDNIIKKNEVNS